MHRMASRRGLITHQSLLLIIPLLVMILTAWSCTGHDFRVVDSRHYNTWITEPDMPHGGFKVNDTLGIVFARSDVNDAVLLVTEAHYASCNTSEPILKLDGEKPRFVLNSTGCYFFISADDFRCVDHERLVVCVDVSSAPVPVIMSPPPTPPPPMSAPSPSPSPSAEENVPSPAPAPCSGPMAGTNGTCVPSKSSSAVAMKPFGILASLLVAAGAAILQI